MGGHINHKWYEFTTADHEIDRYGGVYRSIGDRKCRSAVIEIIDW